VTSPRLPLCCTPLKISSLITSTFVSMRTNSCRFDWCKRNLINKHKLTRSQRQHVRRFHEQETHTFSYKGAIFWFQRKPSCNMAYVCPCGTLLSTPSSIITHVQGTSPPDTKRKPCPTIADILTTLETPPHQYENGNSYFNVRLAKPAPNDADTNEEDTNEEDTNEEDPSDQPAVSETNDDVDDVVDVQEEPTDDVQEPDVDLEHILDENDRALQEAMEKIVKARADIQKLRSERARWRPRDK